MAIDVQTVLDAFEPSLFHPELDARTQDDVLRALVVPVTQNGIARDADVLLEMLKSRERLGSTGIGHGVAVPHGRSLAISKLVAGFARLTGGVEWGAVDGRPVTLCFLILAPPLEQPSRYLPFLGRIVEAVNDSDRRRRLSEVRTFDAFRETMRDALA